MAYALIVWWNDSRAEYGLGMPSDLGDSVHLNEVLCGAIADVLDHALVGIQNGVLVVERGREPELITDGSFSRLKVAPGRDMNFVEHIVVEIIYVRSDPWFFVGIDAERDDERFRRGRWRSYSEGRN